MSMKPPDRPPVLIPVLALSVLVFLLGTAVVQLRLFPYPQFLEPAYQALEARRERARLADADPSMLEGEIHWRRARTPDTGVTRRVAERSAGGYTLYTSTHASAALLLDEEGAVVHRWALPFHEAWTDPPHVPDPVGEESIWWSAATALPDGSLVAIWAARGDTPYGYGMVKVDRDSRVVWRLAENTHHDIRVLDDGSILTLAHAFRDVTDGEADAHPALPRGGRILDDLVLRVSGDGEVMSRTSLVDAFAASDFSWVLSSTYLVDDSLPAWDVLHANAARPVGPAFAARHAFAREGMVLVSLRSPSLLALVDPDAGRVAWMRRGLWRFQHDPWALESGNLLLFDNQGFPGDRAGRSRILEVDPATGARAWSYAGTEADPFYSEFSGHVQPLAGGNVLVTESNAGRIFEVTRDGDVVWEFWNPARTEEGGVEYVASVADARRYPAGALPFLRAP